MAKSNGTAGQNGFQLYNFNGTPFFRVNNATARGADRPLAINKWEHVIVNVSSDATVSWYLNGVAANTPATTGALSGITTSNAITMGNRSLTADRGWNGNLAELGIISLAGRGDLTPAEISQLYTSSIRPTGSSNFWKLDEQPSTYADSIGGATGTGTATTYSTDVPTQQPVALDTEARSSLKNGATNTDGIAVENSAGEVTDNISDQTFEVEFMPTQLQGATKYLFSIPAGGGGNRRYLQLTSTNLIAYYIGSANATLSYKASPLKWYIAHVTVDAVAQTVDIWFNGQRIAKDIATTIGTGNADVFFGNFNTSTGTDAFIGYIKTGRVWRQKLTDQEIRDRVFSNVIPYENQPSILTCDLRMNEGAGTIAYDSSGNGNDGTITGATWSAKTPTKAPVQIGGNLVKNGDLAYQPPFVAATTSSGVWIDGSASGSATNNLFGWYTITGINNMEYSIANNEAKVSATSAAGRGRILTGPFETTPTQSQIIEYGMMLKPNTSYTFSFRAKGTNILANAVRGNVLMFTSAGTFVTNTTTNIATGDSDWTEYSNTFTTGSTVRRATIRCTIETAGNVCDAYFKDISLTETSPTTHLPVSGTTQLTCP